MYRNSLTRLSVHFNEMLEIMWLWAVWKFDQTPRIKSLNVLINLIFLFYLLSSLILIGPLVLCIFSGIF